MDNSPFLAVAISLTAGSVVVAGTGVAYTVRTWCFG